MKRIDLASIQAVYGPKSAAIHLYAGQQRTYSWSGTAYEIALCGQDVTNGATNGRVFVPLADAVALERRDIVTQDPRPQIAYRGFCPKCLGVAIVAAEVDGAAVDLILKRIGGAA